MSYNKKDATYGLIEAELSIHIVTYSNFTLVDRKNNRTICTQY